MTVSHAQEFSALQHDAFYWTRNIYKHEKAADCDARGLLSYVMNGGFYACAARLCCAK
jgi:hypothetical protein